MVWVKVLGMGGPSASLTVALDKSAYSAGELVRGIVTLAVFRETTGDELVVRIRGEERISWVELVTEGGGGNHHESPQTKRKERTKKNAFLNDKILVFAFPRTFAKGHYEFPFAYQSHASLPGVFSMRQHNHSEKKNIRDLHATITYSIRAKLDEGYFFDSWNTHARCDLVLHELPKIGVQYGDSNYSGSFDAKSQCVRLLSLLDQGKCEIAASLGKSVYRSGDSAKLQYHIKNASQMHIQALKVSLYQDVYLGLKQSKTKSYLVSTKVAHFEFAGVPSKSEVNSFLSLALRASDGREIAPSTNGALVKCGYRVHLQCDIRWCSDPCLDLPIVITAIPMAIPVATTATTDFQQRDCDTATTAGIH